MEKPHFVQKFKNQIHVQLNLKKNLRGNRHDFSRKKISLNYYGVCNEETIKGIKSIAFLKKWLGKKFAEKTIDIIIEIL
jgi:hypothetical protein